MPCGKSSLFSVAIALLVANFDITSRNGGVEAADMFTYSVRNSIRDPKFSATASVPVDGRPFARYMEDLFLTNSSKFKSFVTNFTAPYGAIVVSINGVKSSYSADKTYWEFFVNHQPFGKGVSFYQPQANDLVELIFVKAQSNRPANPY